MKRVNRQNGFGMISIVIVLVVLAALGAALVRLSNAARQTVDQELMAARAEQAAKAGAQWGLYRALKGSWTQCAGVSQTLDLTADFGTRVTVRCDSKLYSEGADPVRPDQPLSLRIYTIGAVACNSGGQCPDDARARQPNYVERSVTVRVTDLP
ncbi:MAG TPA: type II secretion system protein [Burkholderiaceae bacterium]|jgi:MSHA biogenesis protein MshP